MSADIEAAPHGHRCGVVALAGLPNAGKSTLLNALLGQKVSITGPKPQTTRISVKGILSRPAWQAVLLDTPGLVRPANLLEGGMLKAAQAAVEDADLVLWLAPPQREGLPRPPEGFRLPSSKTVWLVTKSDALPRGPLLEYVARLAQAEPHGEPLMISARKKEGLEALEDLMASRLPLGPALFPEEDATDLTLRQLAAEVIREKALLLLRDEIPHSLAVEVEDYKETGTLHSIRAVLYVERESQKGVVIGKGGAMLKKIGTAARRELEPAAGSKIFLELWVKVAKDWKRDLGFLKRLGYPGFQAPDARGR